MMLCRIWFNYGLLQIGWHVPLQVETHTRIYLSVFSRVIKLERDMEHDLSLLLSHFTKSMYNNESWTHIIH